MTKEQRFQEIVTEIADGLTAKSPMLKPILSIYAPQFQQLLINVTEEQIDAFCAEILEKITYIQHGEVNE